MSYQWIHDVDHRVDSRANLFARTSSSTVCRRVWFHVCDLWTSIVHFDVSICPARIVRSPVPPSVNLNCHENRISGCRACPEWIWKTLSDAIRWCVPSAPNMHVPLRSPSIRHALKIDEAISVNYSSEIQYRLAWAPIGEWPSRIQNRTQIELKTTKKHKKIKISIFIGIVITGYFTLHFFVCYVHSVELWAFRFTGFYQVFDIIAVWITHCFPRNIEMCSLACSNDDSVMPHGKPETTQRTTTFWSQQLIGNWVLIHWFYPINSTPTHALTHFNIPTLGR